MPDCLAQGGQKVEVSTSAGLLRFDPGLSFSNSPFWGLGVGYDITNLFQLNLSFAFSPTQQTFRTASSSITTKIFVYSCYGNVRFSPPVPMVAVKPFLAIGLGGLIFDPGATQVNLPVSPGVVETVELPTDRHLAINIRAGIRTRLRPRTWLKFEFWRSMIRIREDEKGSRGAHSDYWGLGLDFRL